MAETSGLWTTSGAPAGHQVASYTQALASDMLAIVSACSGYEGVAPGYLSELAPTSTGANNVRIASGGAMVDGKYYKNTANIDTNIISAVGGGNTRIDRIVIRCTWADFHAELHLLSGSDAAVPSAPAITQTSGTTYDIQVCQVLVDTAGAITITDERKWAIVDTDESTLEDAAGALRVKDLGITTAKIAASAVTAAKIADRTRTIFVPAFSSAGDFDALGVSLADGADTATNYGHLSVPADFVSGMSYIPVVYPFGTGTLRWATTAYYGANGQVYSTHNNTTGTLDTAVTISQFKELDSVSLASIAAGDYIVFQFTRFGAHGNDTVGAAVSLKGFVVSYTADS